MKKTKKEWIEWFNSLDDDVEIEFNVLALARQWKKEKLKKIEINF